MADSIEAIIERRIERARLDDDVAIYVMAALDGTLDQFINGGSEKELAERLRPAAAATAPTRAFLLRVSVAGFRGVGPQADLEVVPGPGLTLVVGANGTGKSSFAEGLEFLLTGENSRWEGKAKEWSQGWRNLHSEAAPLLQANFAVEGVAGPAVVSRLWRPEATELDDHATETDIAGERGAGLATLGWETALETHRPFLSYSQAQRDPGEGPVGAVRRDGRRPGSGSAYGSARAAAQPAPGRPAGLSRQRARILRVELLGELAALDDERARTVRAALATERRGTSKRSTWCMEGVLDDDARPAARSAAASGRDRVPVR